MRARTMIVIGSTAGMLVLGGAPARAGGGCMHGTGPSEGGGTVVELVDACFTPTVLHVDAGAEVTFVNRDDTIHEVTGVGGGWGSFDDLGLGDRVSYTFEEAGVYVYSCFVHPGMVGAVVAGSADGAGTADPASVTGGTVTGGITGAPTVEPGNEGATAASDGGGELRAALVGGTVGLVLCGGLAATAVRRRRAASAGRVAVEG